MNNLVKNNSDNLSPPRYFIVNFELGVKVYEDQGDVVAVTNFGTEYPPVKALYEGQEITAEQYDEIFHGKNSIIILRLKSQD